MKKRRILFCAGAVLLLVAIAAVMMVIGRGHTLYFDNVALEYGGETYDPPYKAKITVNGEKAGNLKEKERGMSTWIGQNFEMLVTLTEEKGGAEQTYAVNLTLPYSMDNIIINIPAVMAGLPQEAWCTEFIPEVPDEPEEEAPGGGDDLTITDDFDI